MRYWCGSQTSRTRSRSVKRSTRHLLSIAVAGRISENPSQDLPRAVMYYRFAVIPIRPSGKRHPSQAARTIMKNPAATATVPIARATRSPPGASLSAVMAMVTTAIVCRSMTPRTSRIVIKPTQQ